MKHMNLTINRLDETKIQLLKDFSCIETDEQLSRYKSKEKRRIKNRSYEMEEFLKTEAFSEQEKSLNTTHLFLDNETGKVVAYISLCNDSIGLEIQERNELQYTYTTVPAIKIARLAVATEYQGLGIGRTLINFAAYMGQEIRTKSGLAFITLDCYEHRVSFYEKIGFVKNAIQPIILQYDSPVSMRLVLDKYLANI